MTQTQKGYRTQELSNPRPDLRICVQTQKRYWTQELSCESASKRRRDTGHRNYQIRVQICESASSGTERKDQIRILQTKTWISKYLDSGARFIKIGT